MIHGPCGDAGRNAPCMKDGRCLQHYLKPFNAETRISRDRYPIQKYDAHINTEIYTSAWAIKYLCKYITKGSDKAQLETTTINNSTTGDVAEQNEVIDEVVQYQNARYIGPCEAVWRTLQFRVHMHYPMLLGFFALCNRHAEEGTPIQYTYPQIPCHYTWNDRNREWNPRTNPPVQNVVTRIYAASITDMPLYALRLFLLHIQGPISFEALRTKDGIIHSTFQEAAVAYGFLESDQEWNNCLTETSLIAPSAAAIRALFVYILINSLPAEPLTLWTNHRERMADDYFFQMCRELSLGNEEELLPNQLDQIYQYILGDIETRLQATGNHLSEFPSMPQEFITELDRLPQLQSLEIVERREYNVEEQECIARELIPGLNEGLRHAFDSITTAINAPGTEYNPHVFFVNGPSGTGKSQLFKALLSHVCSQNQIALPVASSGIAATLLPGGRTAHSRFKIPLNANDNTTCNLRLGGSHAYFIQRASLIIWDETVMCSKHNFEAVDRSLRDIIGALDPALNDVPFGGKVVVFGSDFRQLLPVVKKGTRSEVVADSIRSASFWHAVQVLHLTVHMHVQQNSDPAAVAFADTLLAIGDGRAPHTNQVQIPQEAILAAKNIDVNIINDTAFSLFPGASRTYNSNDTIIDHDDPEAAAASYP
ncbi:hypothetical protein INT45_001395, partial [Circinella minor]